MVKTLKKPKEAFPPVIKGSFDDKAVKVLMKAQELGVLLPSAYSGQLNVLINLIAKAIEDG